jgi:potassium efflux system protein
MINKYKIYIVAAIILITLLWMVYENYLKKFGNSMHIAFVGPMSGEGKTAGDLMTQAIRLHFDHINQRGGVNGKYLVLDIYDDRNDPQLAEQRALEIANQNRAVAVIGHWYSSASISAGKIYKKYKIPAITPGSTNIKVTQDNEWYFRNIYNASASGQFLANYIKNVFGETNVSIIREEAAYGAYLANVFEEQARKIGMTVKYQWRYDNSDQSKKTPEDLDFTFKRIVQELEKVHNQAGIILLAVKASEGVKLVKLIKDRNIQNTMIGSSSLSEETFRNGFDTYPVERENPGYYINDIYVATPLIFDTANENAQAFFEQYQTKYDQAPDWSAAYAYDTALVLVEALKKAKIKGASRTIEADRNKLKETLASFTNLYEAIEGVTGFNYFDKNRDAQKLVSLGVYKQKQSVSALTQLHVVRNPNEIKEIDKAVEDKRVLLINDQYMYKTNVVYVGINYNEIRDINMKELVCHLDFKIWFRSRVQEDFKPQDIQWLNAVNPLEIQTQLENPLDEKIKDKIHYRTYRIQGKFRIDFLPQYHAYKQHVIGVNFRHRTLTRNNLIYVNDVLGMGLLTEASLVKRLLKHHVLNPAEGWRLNRVWFFPDIAKEYSAGDPEHLDAPRGIVEYSRFNAAMQIKKDYLTLRSTIPYEYAYNIMLISGLFFLILTFAGSKQKFTKTTWFFQVIFAFLWLLSGEIIFADWLVENTNYYEMKYIVRIFDILWWIIPAYLINVASERFIWTPLEEQVGTIPNIIRHFFALLVYGLALMGIAIFVYEQEFTSLLATSGMIAMIIGLAIQINISNVFSGIVINMERPFRIGDWVQIGEYDEGVIIDINWRATRLQRRDGCMVSIPNSVASESVIINFFYPNEMYWLWPTVYVHPQHSPTKIKKILTQALQSCEKIRKQPEPVVIFTGVNEWSASYWVAFCADDYANKYYILEEVWNQVWNYLNRSKIAHAVMRQEIHVFKGSNPGDLKTTSIDMVPDDPSNYLITALTETENLQNDELNNQRQLLSEKFETPPSIQSTRWQLHSPNQPG